MAPIGSPKCLTTAAYKAVLKIWVCSPFKKNKIIRQRGFKMRLYWFILDAWCPNYGQQSQIWWLFENNENMSIHICSPNAVGFGNYLMSHWNWKREFFSFLKLVFTFLGRIRSVATYSLKLYTKSHIKMCIYIQKHAKYIGNFDCL